MTPPLLLGHRGARASRNTPENTLASFALCLKHGCDGFEFDVRLSGDGQAVICHDSTVAGMEIANSPEEVLSLPTLTDVLHQFAGRAFLDIELKVSGLEALTLAALQEYRPQKGYVISSFLPQVLAAVRDLDPAIPLGFLCETRDRLSGWHETPVEWIIPQFELADRELVRQVHAAGKNVMVWTVNDPGHMREFAAWGVDAIISDETDRLAEIVRAP
jgi:glycerophosphoryl diester phosphodiesterase